MKPVGLDKQLERNRYRNANHEDCQSTGAADEISPDAVVVIVAYHRISLHIQHGIYALQGLKNKPACLTTCKCGAAAGENVPAGHCPKRQWPDDGRQNREIVRLDTGHCMSLPWRAPSLCQQSFHMRPGHFRLWGTSSTDRILTISMLTFIERNRVSME